MIVIRTEPSGPDHALPVQAHALENPAGEASDPRYGNGHRRMDGIFRRGRGLGGRELGGNPVRLG
jgi:hypothetical protein